MTALITIFPAIQVPTAHNFILFYTQIRTLFGTYLIDSTTMPWDISVVKNHKFKLQISINLRHFLQLTSEANLVEYD